MFFSICNLLFLHLSLELQLVQKLRHPEAAGLHKRDFVTIFKILEFEMTIWKFQLYLHLLVDLKKKAHRQSEDKLADISSNRGRDAGCKLDQRRQELLGLVHHSLRLGGWPIEQPEKVTFSHFRSFSKVSPQACYASQGRS